MAVEKLSVSAAIKDEQLFVCGAWKDVSALELKQLPVVHQLELLITKLAAG